MAPKMCSVRFRGDIVVRYAVQRGPVLRCCPGAD